MQTFLPFPSFERSAASLDWRRLGKQRVEAKQILDALQGTKKGWANHPAVKMWRGYEDALKAYFNAVSAEWVRRGYQHNMGFFAVPSGYKLPPWLGSEELHRSHRSNLVRKQPQHYSPQYTDVDGSLPYVWPTRSST